MKFWQVDSFTEEIFKGNPAAVVLLDSDISDTLKQNIAMEMSVSETAFVLLKDREMEIRWFTPNAEVNLCGHATLAAAHILWSECFIRSTDITFTSKSGPLYVTRVEDSYTLNFPSQPPVESSHDLGLLEQIIGMKPLYVGTNNEDCIAVLPSPEDIRSARPILDLIRTLPERGLLLTSEDTTGEFDYIYRAFYPKLDVPEDPVTGSANTLLAPFWAQKFGKRTLTAYQASKRGGQLALEVDSERVLITGKAKTVMVGDIFADGA